MTSTFSSTGPNFHVPVPVPGGPLSAEDKVLEYGASMLQVCLYHIYISVFPALIMTCHSPSANYHTISPRNFNPSSNCAPT